MKKLSIFLSVVFLALCFSSCKKNEDNKLTATEIRMDTVVTLTIPVGSEDVLDGAFDVCRKYEKLFSRTIESSDVSRINTAEGKVTKVSLETAELISLALEISAESNGAFDITVLPLVELWNINEATTPPKAEDISSTLKHVGYNNLSLNKESVSLAQNTKIDLGGIAKGYIADKVRDYLLSERITEAIINLGGNVTVIGDNDGKNYSVGIQKPFSLHGESAAILKLENKTAVTSGIYERYFKVDNTIYHHIIDPKIGYPVQNNVASVTVIADSSALADSLSTACLVLGIEQGMKLAKSKGAEIVLIDTNGKITVSNGLKIDHNGTIPKIILK